MECYDYDTQFGLVPCRDSTSEMLNVEIFRFILKHNMIDSLSSNSTGAEIQNWIREAHIPINNPNQINQLIHFKDVFFSLDGKSELCVKLSSLGGWGVFATTSMKKGRFLTIFGCNSKQKGISTMFPCVSPLNPANRKQSGDLSTSFPSMDGPLAFVNHACGKSSNAEFSKQNISATIGTVPNQYRKLFRDAIGNDSNYDKQIISAKLKNNVLIGDEITIDYGVKLDQCNCQECDSGTNC